MRSYKLGVLAGDGIGREIIEATTAVLEAAAKKKEVKIEWVPLPMGFKAIEKNEQPMPESTITALTGCDGWLLGPHDSASYPERYKAIRNPSGELRHRFDLYANIRPAKSSPFVEGLVQDADLIIYRENTEGFYVDRNMYQGVGEWMVTTDVAVTAGVFTRQAIERIAHAAFQKARTRRKKVTIVHKANVIRLGTGLFLRVCQEVAKEYPDVEVDDYHIDAMCAHLVRRIHDFDIVVTENMFGDILSDLTGELVGSLGLAPSINANDTYAMAQAAHGSAPDIANQDIANPMGMLQSAVMLLDWLGERHDDVNLGAMSASIEEAVSKTLSQGVRTRDLGGEAGTREFAQAIIKSL
ncbi:isocitrate/isopropylmalate dehydrogenase family protein [Shouchella shacheensis]|uniref:isocitrate/isopropylmalate dehydrogenase family protein n=1 Tax=Shouchella shacheensis TaxID=1649580 RepID=UPI00073FEBC7|nr:isocitrate/isopropylmalate dehydrogenase family protein [Shouchella shacheensis]